jgi:hypothetical protein
VGAQFSAQDSAAVKAFLRQLYKYTLRSRQRYLIVVCPWTDSLFGAESGGAAPAFKIWRCSRCAHRLLPLGPSAP